MRSLTILLLAAATTNTDGAVALEPARTLLVMDSTHAETLAIGALNGKARTASRRLNSQCHVPDTYDACYRKSNCYVNGDYCECNVFVCCPNNCNFCSRTNGVFENSRTCICGNSECTSDTGMFCTKSKNKCSRYKACANTNGHVANSRCQCGSNECTNSTGMFCTKSKNRCSTYKACANTNGLDANSARCLCGSLECKSIESTGMFCKIFQDQDKQSTSNCSKLPTCADTDGNVANVAACNCGDAGTVCTDTTGLFCDSYNSYSYCRKNPSGWEKTMSDIIFGSVVAVVVLLGCGLCYCYRKRKANKKKKRRSGAAVVPAAVPAVVVVPAANNPHPVVSSSPTTSNADSLRLVFKIQIIDTHDRYKGFHELPLGNTSSVDLIIKMGFNLKKVTPNIKKEGLSGLFATALCDAQLVKYCHQSFQCLPGDLPKVIAGILESRDDLKWPSVTETSTDLLVLLSAKILANDSTWMKYHKKIQALQANVEARDVIGTCDSYTALSLLLYQIVTDENALRTTDELLEGLVRCSAWLADNFITSLFLMFNIVFMSTVGEAIDERQKREKMLALNKESDARQSQLSRVKASETNTEVTSSAASELTGLFDRIDTNHDGMLNANELCQGLRMINPDGNWNLESVTSLMKLSNCSSTDSSGQLALDVNEFARVVSVTGMK